MAGGPISELIACGDLDGKLGHSRILHRLTGTALERVLLVGCGQRERLDAVRFRKILFAAAEALAQTGASSAAHYLTEIEVDNRDSYWKLRQCVECSRETLYRFELLKSKKEAPAPRLRSMRIWPAGEASSAARQALREGTAIANGVALARDLGNLPANICTPSHLASQARAIARGEKAMVVRTRTEADMKRLGMGALLAVARGSREPAKLITVEYRAGRKRDKPVVLIGKGVTFDSGGVSIKPAAAMDEMKFDMCGAAAVLGTLKAVAELQLPVNLVAIIPATENLPDGNATKPGDVVTSMSKQTIEVLNTDAEGRLILCDAMTLAERFDPDTVIDVATLTGACVVALGAHASGLFANTAALAEELLAAGDYAGDRAWQLPLWEDYHTQLKSNFADVANIGGRDAGAVTAACFLSRFAEHYRWAHLDIAGTAWRTGDKKGATGRPVSLLTQFLLTRTRSTSTKAGRKSV
jgi:leucyl aminopeptidase